MTNDDAKPSEDAPSTMSSQSPNDVTDSSLPSELIPSNRQEGSIDNSSHWHNFFASIDWLTRVSSLDADTRSTARENIPDKLDVIVQTSEECGLLTWTLQKMKVEAGNDQTFLKRMEERSPMLVTGITILPSFNGTQKELEYLGKAIGEAHRDCLLGEVDLDLPAEGGVVFAPFLAGDGSSLSNADTDFVLRELDTEGSRVRQEFQDSMGIGKTVYTPEELVKFVAEQRRDHGDSGTAAQEG